ncbi:MAG: hypothetical protein KDI79_08300 [Anaerolineae bacterium]|nr:hypothetical protein [Anaerolineae bacterium]
MTKQRTEPTLDQPGWYRISIHGYLDMSWSEYLGGLEIRRASTPSNPTVTILTGYLLDQAALFGVLNSLYGLGLPLLSVERLAR